MVGHPLVGFVVSFLCFCRGGRAQYDNCTNGTVTDIGNGWCDAVNNNPHCGFDGGDCCSCTCVNTTLHSCSESDLDCVYPECTEPAATSEDETCEESWIGDGYCDEINNTPSCGYDGGDCCECSCDNSPFNACGSNGFQCLDPACFDATIVAEFPDCTGSWSLIGDGSCEYANNNPACGYDGGDCCLCSCSGINCARSVFDCLDPDAYDELYDCQSPPPVVLPCSASAQQTWVVGTSGEAKTMAAAVNCSGGSFEVEWVGRVVLDEAIYVVNGTVLSVTGGGSSAVIDGNAATRLFTVDNAVLQLSNVKISSGASIAGGAISAAGSMLRFNRTKFMGNTATGQGGAVYVSGGSNVTCAGTTFSGNGAGIDGGAMYVTGRSVVSCAGAWLNNTAGDTGGALVVLSSSSASWSDDTRFAYNGAGRVAGAVHLYDGSSVFWNAVTFFLSNTAGTFGGALLVGAGSNASWSASTTFSDNEAGYTGGAAMVEWDSRLSWSGDNNALFERNRAGFYGGALQIVASSHVSSAEGTTVIFSENSAEHGGGAVSLESYSNVSFRGNTSFDNNTALGVPESKSGWGGALLVDSSTAALSGRVTFAENRASDGGALYASRASVGWVGEMLLEQNHASDTGGALFSWNSNLSWVGGTKVFDNSAKYHGGALYSEHPSISWTGDTEIFNNSAKSSGGALYFEASAVLWKGTTTFAENQLLGNDSSGGAIIAYNGSSVSWSGYTRFTDNRANLIGGALTADYSQVSWSGNTYFARNTATIGGAIFLVNGSHVGWTGATEFASNEAFFDGGAVGSTSLKSSYNKQESILQIGGATSFLSNTAGQNGGGLSLPSCFVDVTSTDVTFAENSAGVSGGAIFQSGSDIGPSFTGVSFISNSAQTGGAVSIFGSGSSLSFGQKLFPTTFDRCRFINNRAVTTCGAIESAAGEDLFLHTLFEENEAATGGALRLAGRTTVYNCSFVESVSSAGNGAAVSNIGIISSMADTSFTRNVFSCEPDEFLNFGPSSTEWEELFEAACAGCQVTCSGCFIDDSRVPKCPGVMDHASSTGGNITLESLSIERGYWRATMTTTEILECYNADACAGGVTDSSGYCLEGYEGPYCAVCSDGYTAGLGHVCNKCPDEAGGIVAAIVVIVVALCVAAAVVSYVVWAEVGGRTRTTVERVFRYIPLQSVKILVVSWQIVTQFASVANATYPGVYQTFLDGLDVFNFDLSWVLSAGCVIDVNFHGRLLIVTISPFIVLLFLAGTYAAAASINRGNPENLQTIWNKHVSIVLLVTFFVYTSVSSAVFQAFACEDLANGNSYLRADYRIMCDSSKHKAYQVYAGFMVVVYAAGIPALYGFLLFKDRDRLKNAEANREESARVTSTSDLWKPYRPSVFYYEVIECGRRVLLAGVVVFIYPNTAAQVAITLMMAVAFSLISESLAPYASRWDTWINRMGHAVVATSMYVALLLKVDLSDERATSQKIFEAALVTAHGFMILSVIVEALIVACSLRGQQGEELSPRFRHGRFWSRGKRGTAPSKTNPFSLYVYRSGDAPPS